MERVIGEHVDGVEGGEDPTVEEGLRAEEDAEEGRQVGLVLIVVGVVEWGGLGEKIQYVFHGEYLLVGDVWGMSVVCQLDGLLREEGKERVMFRSKKTF